MINLNISNTKVKIETHEVNGEKLYRVQDFLREIISDRKKRDKKIENWKISKEKILPEFRGLSIEGRKGGTYCNEEGIYSLAMYVDEHFHLNVVRAFKEIVKGNICNAQWLASRIATKDPYKNMCEAVKNAREKLGKDSKFFHYSNEADMLNKLALGMKAKQYKEENDIPENEEIRDHLKESELKLILKLENANCTLIELGMDYETRKENLKKLI